MGEPAQFKSRLNLEELVNQSELTSGLAFNTRIKAWFQTQEWPCLEWKDLKVRKYSRLNLVE
jgi:hypothetical protein